MFTIKQVLPEPDRAGSSTNTINLWEGANVSLWTDEIIPKHAPEVPYLVTKVSFDMINGGRCTIDYGIVYVMNASGKTVETFRLKGSELI